MDFDKIAFQIEKSSALRLLRSKHAALALSFFQLAFINRFQENPEIPLLLAGIKSGGLGLNLTAADYCFILDPWWNPAVEQQAIDRIYRIGQEKPVNVYRIVSQSTIEEKMLTLQEQKQKIANQLVSADHAFLQNLNFEDFRFLFN